ncbi:restriction endonuclease subunit S [Campylobacter novaezeelandiae]|uniref:restriction endonuclease subunit S n=1 Tax=Campylobacter novaezeelandiae TaxID=2267891 RepID=UPI001037C419|nr:restriction endonuclease subunit S [Campylobacter novaezeelandiae]TBR80429.1 restriction endonuclease subunit S [Campylobacter novaezeelandiae]
MKTKTWKINKLEKICEILNNKRVPISQKDRISGIYPYYGASGIVDYIDKYIFDEELVLIGEDGAKWGAFENSAFIASGKYWVNNHAHILKPNNEILINKFLVYFLNYSNLEKYITGATVKKLNQQKLKQIEILLPPLKEQKRIVGILDESFANIDESIKILEQDLLNLDELMQSALQKTFNPLKDTTKENYQLPQDWEWKSLGEICEINPRNKVDDEINISFISMDKILDGYNNKFSYVIKKWKDVKKGFTHFKQGDIGLAKITPCFENKKSVIFNNLENGIGAGTTELHIIRVGNYIISKFLLWFFKTEKFIKNGILNMTGATGHKRVPKDFIKNLQIPLPPLQEQEKIASYLDELSLNIKDLKQNYQTQIKNLQELKKSLLDRAFKGRL